jgi:hypothetical protein
VIGDWRLINVILQLFSTLSAIPQDWKYAGERCIQPQITNRQSPML